MQSANDEDSGACRVSGWRPLGSVTVQNGNQGRVQEALVMPADRSDGETWVCDRVVEDCTLWECGKRRRVGFLTIDEWLDDARSRGFVVTPVPELTADILSPDSGTPFKLAHPAAMPGYGVVYVLLWPE